MISYGWFKLLLNVWSTGEAGEEVVVVGVLQSGPKPIVVAGDLGALLVWIG